MCPIWLPGQYYSSLLTVELLLAHNSIIGAVALLTKFAERGAELAPRVYDCLSACLPACLSV